MTLDEFEKWMKEFCKYGSRLTGDDLYDNFFIKKEVTNIIMIIEPLEDRNFIMLKYSEYLK